MLVIRNADTSFVYFPTQDGVFPAVPANDSFGMPTDFSDSASLRGAREVDLTGQGIHDPFAATAHLGILNSPDTWKATFEFLTASRPGEVTIAEPAQAADPRRDETAYAGDGLG